MGRETGRDCRLHAKIDESVIDREERESERARGRIMDGWNITVVKQKKRIEQRKGVKRQSDKSLLCGRLYHFSGPSHGLLRFRCHAVLGPQLRSDPVAEQHLLELSIGERVCEVAQQPV